MAFVFALDAECRSWRSRHAFRSIAKGSPRIFETTVNRVRVRAAVCGVGAPNVAALADTLCDGDVDLMVAVGLAGALRASHPVGEVIVARKVRSAISGTSIAGADRLVSIAVQAGARPVDVLVCADRVAGRVENKRRLAILGDAVDMESFHVLREAARRGIASTAIRVIGDAADEDLPLDFNRVIRADGTVKRLGLIGEATRTPSRWPELIAFGRRQRSALRGLADVLDRFVDISNSSFTKARGWSSCLRDEFAKGG
jgi:nucleoside phosphorylase